MYVVHDFSNNTLHLLLLEFDSNCFVMWCQVIHGLLDRVMQLLDVPFSAKKDKAGYYIKAADGERRLSEENWKSYPFLIRTYLYIRDTHHLLGQFEIVLVTFKRAELVEAKLYAGSQWDL